MSEDRSTGIILQQKQLLGILIGVVILISGAIIFSAIFVTNLIQSQVAQALKTQQTTQPAVATVTPAQFIEEPLAGTTVSCTEPPQQTTSETAATTRSADSTAKKSVPKKAQAPKSRVSNNYKTINKHETIKHIKNINTKNITNTTNYTHSFNQGSYNEVKGDLTQIKSNNNTSVDTTVTNNDSHNDNSTTNNSLNIDKSVDVDIDKSFNNNDTEVTFKELVPVL